MREQIEFIKSQGPWTERSIEAVLKLHAESATLAFIARYRKDSTGNLDELAIMQIIELAETYSALIKRRQFILENIAAQGKLNPELKQKIESCLDKNLLEDLYLPYKQRKKTKADMAMELGLEGLAKIILSQRERHIDQAAERFLKNGINDPETAIAGALDIIAQWIADDISTREMLRARFEQHAFLETKLIKGKETEGEKYKDYFNTSEKAGRIPSHRLMAILRAEKEKIVKIKIEPDESKTLEALDRKWIKRDSACENLMLDSIEDAYKRLLKPAMENELKQVLFEKAEGEAIRVFAENLQQLLMSSPLGNKRIVAVDPGIRSGCKTVCLNENGGLEKETVLYFNSPAEKQKSLAELSAWIKQFQIEAIAVGNGTAGRETYDLIKTACPALPIFLVNEDGASVYSVSEIARREFPNHDVTVKGAVSIGRRLLDPLAELVKIDAKSLGVGQYQHDVNQGKLKKALNETVVHCVNKVGVNLNTAGQELLKHVSGLGEVLAGNIISYREKNGNFRSREELKQVARLGEKAFEQCAGFLRVPQSENLLDNSAVHPENYRIVEQMVKTAGLELNQVLGHQGNVEKLKQMTSFREKLGNFTFNDLMQELEKPGLDPRPLIESNRFDDAIRKMEDLKPGMILNGIVSNLTNFGAFIDIGIKENGLLHISEMSDQFIKSPTERVALNQHLKLKVKDIDMERKRIALTLKF